MACEKNTEQMNDVSHEREDSMNTMISEQPGTDMINETIFTDENGKKKSNTDAEDSRDVDPVPTPDSKRSGAQQTNVLKPQTSEQQPVDAQKKFRFKAKEELRMPNTLREFRIEQMMSKAELARKAGLSVLTIDRIEKGFGCRMDTKRKILKALGLKLSDRCKLFQEE